MNQEHPGESSDVPFELPSEQPPKPTTPLSAGSQKPKSKINACGVIFAIGIVLILIANIIGWIAVEKGLTTLELGCDTGASFVQLIGPQAANADVTPQMQARCHALAQSAGFNMHLQGVWMSTGAGIVATGFIFVVLAMIAFFSGGNTAEQKPTGQ